MCTAQILDPQNHKYNKMLFEATEFLEYFVMRQQITRIGSFYVIEPLWGLTSSVKKCGHFSLPFVSVGLANVSQFPIVHPCWMCWQNLVSEAGKMKPERPHLINLPTSLTVSFSFYLTSNNPDEGAEKSLTKKITTRYSHSSVPLTALGLVCEI